MSRDLNRLGVEGDEPGLYVRFEPGFGLNVYVGHRKPNYKQGDPMGRPSSYVDGDDLAMSIQGWERLCEMVDEWRERSA